MKPMLKITLAITIVLLALGCSAPAEKTSETTPQQNSEQKTKPKKENLALISKVESAHGKSEFLERENVAFDILLSFGGKERLNGRLTISADSRHGKIERNDGGVILFNDDKVHVSPEIENTASARFAAYTWSYFFMFPYKLSDPGTNWTPYANGQLGDLEYDAAKLTFSAGTGDAPDDWYIMYADENNHLINTAAYIVTAGNTREEAEKDPHAIEYCDYKSADGIPVARTWRFWAWRENQGLTKQLGNASISNVQFKEVKGGFYSPLRGYREVN